MFQKFLFFQTELLDSNSDLRELLEKKLFPRVRTFQVPLKGDYSKYLYDISIFQLLERNIPFILYFFMILFNKQILICLHLF